MKIKSNSKKIEQGDTFIALKGLTNDGHDYIEEAILNGASKIIAEYGNYDVPTLIVPDTKKYLIEYLEKNCQPKIKNLKIIGVTGTNGKTTSCFLIYQMLNKLNIACAYIGTLGFYLKDNIIKLNNTTPDILELYNLLLKCQEENIKYVVMEVSSHALDMQRVAGLEFDYAIFTNLTIDHIDYHHDISNYANCKKKLFKMLKDDGYAIINNDADYKERMMVHKNNITYGFSNSDYKVIEYKMDINNTAFSFIYNHNTYKVITPIIGKYNIYNILTMIIVVNLIGISLKDITKMIPTLKAPPGRMDKVMFNDKCIIIDYAHTPDAVFNILNAVKEFSKGKIYSIIGCGGDRDRNKRNKMTFYATSLSDMVIITSDNPRGEDVNQIIDDMLKDNIKDNYQIIVDRKEAIKYGIEALNAMDTLVIMGKGHEDYQVIGNEKLHHNDKEYVLNLCR